MRQVDPIIYYDVLREYDALCFPDDRRIRPTPPEVWWIEENEGYCALRPSYQYGDVVYLNRAGVLPQARGKGLQRRFIRTRLMCARRRGYAWAVTDCTSDNYASCNNLIRSGFELYQPRRPWGLRGSLYWYRAI